MAFTRGIINTAQTDPGRPALTDASGTTFTYDDLMENSAQFQGAIEGVLRSIDADRAARFTFADDLDGIPVIALCISDAVTTASLIAIAAGYRYVTVTLDSQWPLEHLYTSIRRSGTQIVITDNPGLKRELERRHWPGETLTPEQLTELSTNAQGEAPKQRDPDEPFLLIFTSGTTDDPKAFLRTRRSWRYNVRISTRYLDATPATVTFAPGPLAYSLTLYALVEVLATGGTLVLQSRFDAIAAARTLTANPIQRLVVVPAVLPALTLAAARNNSEFTHLTSVISGGAFLKPSARQQFQRVAPNAKILSYYGAAEIGFIAYSITGDDARLTPFDGLELQVRTEDGTQAAEGELGTLYVRVPSQADRYLDTTGGRSITGPDGWSTVEDQARLEEGKLILEGRAGDIVNTGGHKVSLVQIERALAAVPGCEHSCVVGTPHQTLGEVLTAVIEQPPSGEPPVPPKKTILDALRRQLPPQYIPHHFAVTDELPRTVGGKIRRVAVQHEVLSGRVTRI